ncbi:argininosuccinate lyase isoform X1 [Apis mellifera]|uniref:Arginosuccinase n=1 Tax=Apis mellifera TaxID=7460 RepID=A0A7M7RCA4_APIME|nr:argininosuccinate lyase isoform X1 [Apis mellifera]|eukprot:XP_624062.4 argininosuccinate lyase isoform X1 [Apis mellifera]
MQENYEKLWGGCFTDNIDPKFHDLNASINIDKRMYAEDIEGSVAYAKAIRLANLLTDEELESILNGFKQMKAEWEEGRFIIHIKDEDIHAANERRLTELIGDVAKKLHIGRSRNDQTITDTKLWLRKAIDVLLKKLMKFIQVLVDRAENEIEIIMPGYTHMQRAQPIKWSQWLLSYAWYAKADIERLQEIRKRVNILPLGSGAIAGNPFQIDRRILANELDFSEITENSMYAIGDRDFVVEFLFWSSLTVIHLSRLCEDLIIYSSEEFGFVRFADKFSTGSSLMPQKRNPDCMELIRGKAGTLLGKCMGFMTTLKGIPSTYNKDLQEDKEAIFSTFDILDSILVIATNAINTLEVKNKKCEKALTSTMLATDMVYYLVRKGISFREAHYLTGKAVALSESLEVSLCKLSLKKLHSISTKFQKDVKEIWNFSHSIEQYKVTGGTSTTALIEQINKLRTSLINNSI